MYAYQYAWKAANEWWLETLLQKSDGCSMRVGQMIDCYSVLA